MDIEYLLVKKLQFYEFFIITIIISYQKSLDKYYSRTQHLVLIKDLNIFLRFVFKYVLHLIFINIQTRI